MADGTFAILTFALGIWDASANYCDTGCFAKREVTPRTAISAGQVIFDGQDLGREIYLRREMGEAFGPFGNAYGVSITDQGSFWIGIGQTYEMTFAKDRGFLQLHAMTGLYEAGDGADLGGPIEFRSGIEVGYEARNGMRYALSFDHRSNADLYEGNPGLETLQFRVSFPAR